MDFDGLKSGEEDGDHQENDDTDAEQDAHWNDQLNDIQFPDFVAATGLYLVLDNRNELNIFF